MDGQEGLVPVLYCDGSEESTVVRACVSEALPDHRLSLGTEGQDGGLPRLVIAGSAFVGYRKIRLLLYGGCR